MNLNFHLIQKSLICFALSIVATFTWTECIFLSQNTLYHNEFWYPLRTKLYHLWGGIDSLQGRFAIANNTLSSAAILRRQLLFSRQEWKPKSIAMDVSIKKDGYIEVLFNFDNKKYQALRLSRSSKYPSMIHTSDIGGKFLKKDLFQDDFLQNLDEHVKYPLKLEQDIHGIKVSFNNKDILQIPEKFEKGFIGLELNEFANIYPLLMTLDNGEEILADFERPFSFKYYFFNFFIISATAVLLSLVRYRHFYKSMIGWLNILIGLGLSWYVFDYTDYSKRYFRWSYPDRAMILPPHLNTGIDYEKIRYNFFNNWYELIGGSYYNNLPQTDHLTFEKHPWKRIYYCLNDKCSTKIPVNKSIPDNTIRTMFIGGSVTEGYGVFNLEETYLKRVQNELLKLYENKLTIESSFYVLTPSSKNSLKEKLEQAELAIKKFKPSYTFIDVKQSQLKTPVFLNFLKEIANRDIIVFVILNVIEDMNPKILKEFASLDPKNQKTKESLNIHFLYLDQNFHTSNGSPLGNLWWDRDHLTPYGYEVLTQAFFFLNS